MIGGQGPIIVRRRLRAELRRLRQAARMSIDDVTKKVEWSPSKLVRIEGGQVGVSVSDLTALLQVYGLRDPARMEELKTLARASRQQTWWSRFQRHVPAAYLEFIGAESDATQIHHYHPTTVPGLLQTRQYAEAINEATRLAEVSPESAKAHTEVRMMRQQRVLERDEPPRLTAILDEAVLRRPVGGQAAMRGQLNHLIDVARRDNVTMVVLPFSAGPHPGLNGAFALMRYGAPDDEDVVCLEDGSGVVVMRDRPEVTAQYRRVADHLVDIGLRDEDAVRFIRMVLDESG